MRKCQEANQNVPAILVDILMPRRPVAFSSAASKFLQVDEGFGSYSSPRLAGFEPLSVLGLVRGRPPAVAVDERLLVALRGQRHLAVGARRQVARRADRGGHPRPAGGDHVGLVELLLLCCPLTHTATATLTDVGDEQHAPHHSQAPRRDLRGTTDICIF